MNDALSSLVSIIRSAEPLVLVGVGTFAGAWLAFILEERRRKKETDRQRCTALIQTIVILREQLDFLERVKKLYLDKFRDTQDRHLKIGALHASAPTQRVNYQQLDFLESAADLATRRELSRAEQAYEEAVLSQQLLNDCIIDARQSEFISQERMGIFPENTKPVVSRRCNA